MNNTRGKWKINNTKEIYKTPWVTVYEDEVIRPDGKNGIFTRIDILPGVSVLPMDEDENVYLATTFQYALNKKILGHGCGGGIEPGETPFEAAKRELKEETGLTAKKWTELGTTNSTNSSIIASPAYLFLAQDLEMGEQVWDGGEEIELIKVPLTQAIEWVMDGKITHPVAQLIILKAYKYLHPDYAKA
jgi:ADP-ribose pyrophosphatase